MFTGWFNSNAPQKIGFEDIKMGINDNGNNYLIINTLPVNEQDCLIQHTIHCDLEEKMVNDLLDKFEFQKKTFLIYGRNSCDNSVDTKYDQLRKLGFSHIYIYVGGLFEWLLLQDIYGFGEFPTTARDADILKYRVSKTFSKNLLLK